MMPNEPYHPGQRHPSCCTNSNLKHPFKGKDPSKREAQWTDAEHTDEIHKHKCKY
jgi:hypothetical protein